MTARRRSGAAHSSPLADEQRQRGFTLIELLVVIVILGVIDNGIHRINWLREIVGMVQMFTPLWTVALVQWLILHTCLSRPAAPAKAAST